MTDKDFKTNMKKVDDLLSMYHKQIENVHKLKFSLFRANLVNTHTEEMWADHLPKKDAKKIFVEYMMLHRNAFGEEPDYDYKTRNSDYAFENWKARTMWDFRKLNEKKIGLKNEISN